MIQYVVWYDDNCADLWHQVHRDSIQEPHLEGSSVQRDGAWEWRLLGDPGIEWVYNKQIQVFSDNDRNSNYLANAWESLYEQLKGSIQMARINFRDRGKFYWLNSMKLSEDNMPLVFSYHKSIGFTLASYDLNRAEVSLKSFIRDNIPSEINFIRAGDV